MTAFQDLPTLPPLPTPPPVQAAFPIAPPKSAWPIAIGVISSIYAFIWLFIYCYTTAIGAFLLNNDESDFLPLAPVLPVILDGALALMTFLMLFGAVRLFFRRRSSRSLILFSSIGLIVTSLLQIPVEMDNRSLMRVLAVATSIYPMFLLIWFFNYKIRKECGKWK